MRCGTLISADWKGSNMSGDGRFQGEDERYWVEASSAEKKKKERIFRVSFCFEAISIRTQGLNSQPPVANAALDLLPLAELKIG